MSPKTAAVLFSLLAAAVIPAASAHQVDSAGEYRIEIGWMQDPAISGEPNGIELYVSPLNPALAPAKQEFKDGIKGLQKDLKIQMVLKGNVTTLPLRSDHNVPGKYFALIEPTIPGYYQVNVIGQIGETVVSKSLHAPKVENEEYLRFPPLPADPIVEEHETFRDELSQVKDSVATLESSRSDPAVGYVGIGIAAVAVAIAVIRRR